MVHAGRRPRPSAVLKKDGDLTKGPDEVKSCWHRHFTKILNILSEYQEEVIADMPSQPTHWDLDGPPTAEEFESVLSKLKRGKAGGRNPP